MQYYHEAKLLAVCERNPSKLYNDAPKLLSDTALLRRETASQQKKYHIPKV